MSGTEESQPLAELWKSAIERDKLAGLDEDESFGLLLGLHYAELQARSEVKLTESGIKKVEEARDRLLALLSDS
jgi:hypothetical protein